MDLRRLTPVLVLLAIVAAVWLGGRGSNGAPAATSAPGAPPPAAGPTRSESDSTAGPASSSPRAPARVPPPLTRPKPDAAGYAPASASPKDAIPGGSLEAHEGLYGAHTIERHVGRSLADLKARADEEGKREVSTFPDVATADRAVAEVLYDQQDRIRRWVASRPGSNEAFEEQLRDSVGTVYRRDSGKTSPGHTVVVVLRASEKFPEGFRIHTAYVSLP